MGHMAKYTNGGFGECANPLIFHHAVDRLVSPEELNDDVHNKVSEFARYSRVGVIIHTYMSAESNTLTCTYTSI